MNQFDRVIASMVDTPLISLPDINPMRFADMYMRHSSLHSIKHENPWRIRPLSGITLTIPIIAGKEEAWRRFCQELAGYRRQMYETSRQRMGITHERLTLVENTFGSAAVITLEADDIGQALDQIVTSDLPFDRWYRDQMQELHGIILTGYEIFVQQTPLLEEQQLLFEWALPSSISD